MDPCFLQASKTNSAERRQTVQVIREMATADHDAVVKLLAAVSSQMLVFQSSTAETLASVQASVGVVQGLCEKNATELRQLANTS